MTSTLICQISDLHIGMDGDDPDERNTRRTRAVFERAAALDPRPDLIVLTGDLSEHGDPASYARLKELLQLLSVPVLLMVGNHDRRAALLDVFPDTPTEAGFVQSSHAIGTRRLILLDTLDEGHGNGAFCTERQDWLDRELAAAPATPTLIALHHPPFPVGIDWMDPAPHAPWIERLRAVVTRHPQIVLLIAGHLHRPIVGASWAGRPCVIASSVAPQLAFDLRPTPLDAPDDRPLVVVEPPSFMLHRWTDDALTSHYVRVEPAPPVLRLDATMVPVLAGYIRDNHG